MVVALPIFLKMQQLYRYAFARLLFYPTLTLTLTLFDLFYSFSSPAEESGS
jgi:hypothetical protein